MVKYTILYKNIATVNDTVITEVRISESINGANLFYFKGNKSDLDIQTILNGDVLNHVDNLSSLQTSHEFQVAYELENLEQDLK